MLHLAQSSRKTALCEKQEAQLSQRDRATRQFKSCKLLHNCTKNYLKRLVVSEWPCSSLKFVRPYITSY